MSLTEHYQFWELDPDEEIAEFPGTWNLTMREIDEAIYAASTSDSVAASRITGTIADAQLPNDIARTGTVDDLDSRITENTRLIGINDEYITSNMNDLSSLETKTGNLSDSVSDLDSRVNVLENSGGSGGSGVYDSGVRKVNSLFPGADMYHPFNSLCTISRFGPIVNLTLATFGFTDTGNVKIGDIPAGFRPPSTLRLAAMSQGEENIQMAVRGGSNDLWAYGVPSSATGYTAHISYRTEETPPVDLPGEPA